VRRMMRTTDGFSTRAKLEDADPRLQHDKALPIGSLESALRIREIGDRRESRPKATPLCSCSLVRLWLEALKP